MLIVAHISKKFRVSYGTLTFSAVLTTAFHITLPCLQNKPIHVSPQYFFKIRCNILPSVLISLKVSTSIYAKPNSMSFFIFSIDITNPINHSNKTSALKCLQTQFRFTIPVISPLCLKNICHRPVPSTSLDGVPLLRSHNSNVHTKLSTCTHKLRSQLPHKTVLQKVT